MPNLTVNQAKELLSQGKPVWFHTNRVVDIIGVEALNFADETKKEFYCLFLIPKTQSHGSVSHVERLYHIDEPDWVCKDLWDNPNEVPLVNIKEEIQAIEDSIENRRLDLEEHIKTSNDRLKKLEREYQKLLSKANKNQPNKKG